MSASPPSSSQGRRHNVSQACINCRQRKKKCDGATPICGTCAAYKDDCVWHTKTDWRKSVSRSEANALRGQVEELQRQLQDTRAQLSRAQTDGYRVHDGYTPSGLGHPPRWEHSGGTGSFGESPLSQMPGVSIASVSPRDPGPSSVRRSLPHEDTDDIDGYLVQDRRGGIRVHAPTSAYRHDSTAEPSTSARIPISYNALRDRDKQWARYLPDIFLTRNQHDLALDRFFRYFGCWGQRATPHLFYRDMEIALWTENEADLSVVAPNYSPLLHNTVLSLGLAFAEEEHLRALSTRKLFIKHGHKFYDRECSAPCVATTQALAIRSSFSSTMGNYSLGWVTMGVANRLCYALGLHVNTSSLVSRGKLNPETVVQRNVTFWTCFCQEGMWAIYIGRKPMMQDYQLPLPTTDQATDDTVWKWPPGPRSSLPPQKSYLSLAFVETARLMQVATEITRTIYTGQADKSALVESRIVQRFSDTLDGWLESLPAPLVVDSTVPDPVLPHVLMIHLAWSWIVILLYQPFSQVASRPQEHPGLYDDQGTLAMTRCYNAATKIVQLCILWRDQHSLRFTPPTTTAIIYSAGTSFLLAAAQAAMPAQQHASLQKVHACLEFLRDIGQTWDSGRQQATILQELLDDCARASLELPALMGEANERWRPQPTGTGGLPEGQAAPVPTHSSSAFQPAAWSGDDTFDQFIQSLLSQTTVPIAATTQGDFLGLGEGFL